jgi:hypothetical protein
MHDVGYLGGSASLELAYAMCYQRPIVLLHPASVKDAVDPFIRDFLLERLHRVAVHDFLTDGPSANMAAIARISHSPVNYDVTVDEYKEIHQRVDTLIEGLAVEHAAT